MPPSSISVPCRATQVDVELTPWPLSPEAIIAGDPRPRGYVLCRLESDGSRLVTGVYACGPGTIRAVNPSTETIHVLEGEVSIELSNGHRVDLACGQVAVIPARYEVTWTFHSNFREIFVLTA